MLRVVRFSWIFVLLLLFLPVLAQSPSEISGEKSDTPITAETAADVIPLARYGRGAATTLVWSPDGTRLAVGGSVGVWLYRVTDFEADLSPLVGHTAPVMSLAFSRDGSRLVSGGADSSLRVWDTDSGDILLTMEVPYSASFNTVAYSPDDSLIVTASLNTLLVWNAETGEPVDQITADAAVPVVKIAFAAENATLAVLLSNGAVNLYDMAAGAMVISLPATGGGNGTDIAWTPDAAGIIRAAAGQGWQRYDAASGSLIAQGSENADIVRMRLAPDGSTLAAAERRSTISLWNADSGENTGALSVDGAVLDVAYSPDGSALAAVTSSGTLYVFDSATGEASLTLSGYHQNSSARTAVFSPDAAQIIIGYSDSRGALVNRATGEFLATLTGFGTPVNQVTVGYSPDGRLLAVSDGFGVSLKNPESGEEAAYLATVFEPVFAWSPDGSLIATGNATGMLQLWNASGELLLSREDHTGQIFSIVFSADGTLLLTAGADGTARLYGVGE